MNSGADLTYRIYRWDGATNTAALSLAFTGDLGTDRIGDTMAVRGAGTNTQILCGFRNTTNAAIFTTTDSLTFSSKIKQKIFKYVTPSWGSLTYYKTHDISANYETDFDKLFSNWLPI